MHNLPSSHPSCTLPAWSLIPTMLFVRIYELWGHLATIFVRRICASHIICTLFEWKCFQFSCKCFFRWCLYSNMCAVDRSDYIRKTHYCCKLLFGWSPASYGDVKYLVYKRMIPCHTAAFAQLKHDWLIPKRSASSLWKEPVDRKPSVVRTCNGTGNVWLLTVSLSIFGPNSAQSSKSRALGNLKRLISQSSLWSL